MCSLARCCCDAVGALPASVLNAVLVCSCSCSQGLADNCVIARVDDELWDLDRPLEKDCSLELLRFDNEDAQAVSI